MGDYQRNGIIFRPGRFQTEGRFLSMRLCKITQIGETIEKIGKQQEQQQENKDVEAQAA